MQKRISNISIINTPLAGKQYEIQLENNYSFDFSGCDRTIVNSVNQ